MIKRLSKTLGTLVAIAAAFAYVFAVLAPQAQAHSPQASIACTGWQLSASNYNPSHSNTLSYSIDGGKQVNVPFTDGTSQSGTFDANSGDHTLVAQFTAWDDPDGSKNWTRSYSLHTSGCPTKTPCPPDSTVTVTAPPVVTTVTATATETKTATETATVTAPPVTETNTVIQTETAPPVTDTATATATETAPGSTSTATVTNTATQTDRSTATATATVVKRETAVKSGTAITTKTHSVTLPPGKPDKTNSPPLALTGSHTGNLLGVAAGLLLAGTFLVFITRRKPAPGRHAHK